MDNNSRTKHTLTETRAVNMAVRAVAPLLRHARSPSCPVPEWDGHDNQGCSSPDLTPGNTRGTRYNIKVYIFEINMYNIIRERENTASYNVSATYVINMCNKSISIFDTNCLRLSGTESSTLAAHKQSFFDL